MQQPNLFDTPKSDALPDQAARDFAVDPSNDVVLEASAGTGKTRVLVERYVRLIDAGVDPTHILAITFTRKAAAEMRDRVIAALRSRGQAEVRAHDLQIQTIDAFCVGLLREFPLEADVDPGLQVADDTETARLTDEAIELTMRAARASAIDDEDVRLLMTRVKAASLRNALVTLIDRRHVALPAVAAFVRRAASRQNAAEVAAAFIERVNRAVDRADRSALANDGPILAPEFVWLRDSLAALDRALDDGAAAAQRLRRRLERYSLTRDGRPRQRLAASFTVDLFPTPQARRRHEAAVRSMAPEIAEAIDALDADVTILLARGLLRVLAIAVGRYERQLDEHALLDFAGMLDRSVRLLERQEEFARSRLKLQSRYHHLLVDEFQDTSRLQWRLIELLVDAWGEGEGIAEGRTSIFVVGDRKQSIYRFRHAEVSLLDEAAAKILRLRPGRQVRQSITSSFRAVPELLSFVNALAEGMQSPDVGDGQFVYRDTDRFPVVAVAPGALRDGVPVLGMIAESSMEACAKAVAAEIARLSTDGVVRDQRGPIRPARLDDIAILFRARSGHQHFERALEARGIRTYVYKGLGFFDAPEVQDLQALIRFLARPDSDLRAAELLRSRFVRLSDVALARLAPEFARVLRDPAWESPTLDRIDSELLLRIRAVAPAWLAATDRVTVSETIDQAIRETAYFAELGGRRIAQARENLKKFLALVRRVESRGYGTVGRLADYIDTLRAGEESNAILDASGCVNLMTIHAAKGLEFPIVFIVNLHVPGRGRGGAVTVIERGVSGEPEVSFGSSDATRLEDQRDREELRRMMYVAATRARDRLYLATEIDDARQVRRSSRSFTGVLPASLLEMFSAAAASSSAAVVWESGRGSFMFDVCRPDAAAPGRREEALGTDRTAPFAPLESVGRSHRRAADLTAAAGLETNAGVDSSATDRLIGTLVHRLFQRQLPDTVTLDTVEALVPLLVTPEETVDVAEIAPIARRVATLFIAFRGRADVAALLASGACRYEVPISYSPTGEPDVLIRAVVDCLVLHGDGSVTVVEFKTGRPRPEHAVQAEVYGRAVAAALEKTRAKVTILYP